MAQLKTVTEEVQRVAYGSQRVTIEVPTDATADHVRQLLIDAACDLVYRESSAEYSVPALEKNMMEHYGGTITIGSESVQIDFAAPVDADVAEVDAAAMGALASVAEVNFVALGTSIEPSKPVLENARFVTLVYVRHEDGQVTTIGILKVRTTHKTEFLTRQALRKAVTQWVNTTAQGRSLWEYSCEDLNLGDLASSSAFQDEQFLQVLLANGIEYIECFVDDCDAAGNYDEVLVDETSLQAD